MSETIRANSWDSSAISESALESRRVRQKIELSYERCAYARKSNNLFSGSFEIPALSCEQYLSRGGRRGWVALLLVSWKQPLLAVKPVKGAASPPPQWLPPLCWFKSIILFWSTPVKLHGFIKRGGFIRAELRHSGTMSIKCGCIKSKFLVITVHSCWPTASHVIETSSFCRWSLGLSR